LSSSSNNNDNNNITFSIDLYLLDDKYTAPVRRLDNPAVRVKYDRYLNDLRVGRVTAMEYLFYSLSFDGSRKHLRLDRAIGHHNELNGKRQQDH
jgi:hypothetical protein